MGEKCVRKRTKKNVKLRSNDGCVEGMKSTDGTENLAHRKKPNPREKKM